MILVYIAGPFSASSRAGVEINIQRAVHVAIEVAKLGAFPVCPHANTAHPDFELAQPYQFWIDGTMALLRVCHAVMLVRGWERSNGARGEAEEAGRLAIPVFSEIDTLERWLDQKRLREAGL